MVYVRKVAVLGDNCTLPFTTEEVGTWSSKISTAATASYQH